MSKFSRHKRKDSNHREIVVVFRLHGLRIDDVSALPDLGYDLLVFGAKAVGGYRAVEIKDGTKPPAHRRLTESEERAAVRHGKNYAVVTTVAEAEALAVEMLALDVMARPL